MNIEYPALGQIPQLRRLWQEAFGDTDAFLDVFFRTAFATNRCLCATENGQLAAAAYWFSCGKYAYIYAVATAKSHRGRGICHQLMAKIHEILACEGYCGCIVVPGEESLRRFYGGMDYRDCGGIGEISCTAGAPLPIRKLTPAEFASLRRQHLPENSVLQEHENLAFLSQWAEFYAGEDFLLAATREGDEIRGWELLGNTHAAAGIVAALGAKSGTFRTPGDTPFAMYHPLTCKNAPAYFGFAFD